MTHVNSKGKIFFLHARQTKHNHTIYFFSLERKTGIVDAMPAGYQVTETPNGLPVLKKIAT